MDVDRQFTADASRSAEREAETVARRILPGASSTTDSGGSTVDGIDDRTAVDDATVRRIASETGTGTPLSDDTRAFFEPRFGRDFSDVRVHTGAAGDRLARSIDAEAFAIGTDVVFQSGAFDPGSAGGRRLLAHELTHVTQQTGRSESPGMGPRPAGGAVVRVDRRPADGGWWDCAKGAAVGAGTGVWELIKAIGGSIWSPIETIKNAYNGIKQLLEQIWALELGEAAKGVFPDIYKLATEWSTLGSYERCRLIGKVISEYGAGILSGVGAVKLLKRLKSLKRSRTAGGPDTPGGPGDGSPPVGPQSPTTPKPDLDRPAGPPAERPAGTAPERPTGTDVERPRRGEEGPSEPEPGAVTSRLSAAQQQTLGKLGGKDRQVIQNAMERLPPERVSFVDDLGKLAEATSDVIPAGKVHLLGTYRGSRVFGSQISRTGIVDVDGATMVVRVLDGDVTILGPFR